MKRGIKNALFHDISYNTVLVKSWVIKLIHPAFVYFEHWQHEGEMSRGSIEDTALIVQRENPLIGWDDTRMMTSCVLIKLWKEQRSHLCAWKSDISYSDIKH